MKRRWIRRCLALVVVVAAAAAAQTRPLATIALERPFATRTPWSLVVTQDPHPAESATGDAEPGVVTPCLRHGDRPGCDPAVETRLTTRPDAAYFATAHYLTAARIVQRRADDSAPLLLLVTASQHAGDGGQIVLTQALAYRRAADRFVRVFRFATGTNNNQAARFIEKGPLRGDIITAEPTADAPFGYWVTVNAPAGASDPYRQVLRYRSATRYGDGNALPVIDSEMPAILRRLSLWHPGQPLPLPASPCPAPHLAHGSLWCR